MEQLSGFLETVLCPLLSNINFVFPGGNVANLSTTSFPTYYRGDELVVSGEVLYRSDVSFDVTADTAGGGTYRYRGQIETVLGKEGEQVCLEGQLHAYQLIRQSLEQISAAETREEGDLLRRQVLEYALRFRFVTDLTSLIVSPLLSEGCDCPSSCSCSPSACLEDTPEEVADGIKINPETEVGDREIDDSYRRGPSGTGQTFLSHVLPPAKFLGLRTTRTALPTTTTTTPTTTPVVTTTPVTTTTTTPASDCGVWRNLSVCVGGTKNYIQVRCGSCPRNQRTRELPCGDSFRGRCYLTSEIGTPVCKLRREARRMGRRIGGLSLCENILSYDHPLDGLYCRYKRGVCSLSS